MKIKKTYEKYTLYAFEEKNILLLEKVLKKEYKIEEEFVNNDKSYVAKITIDDTFYVIKKIIYKGKLRRKIRKYLTFFKQGDCLKALVSIKEAQEKNCEELASIYGVGIYKKGIIHDQFMIMEYAIGRAINVSEDYYVMENFLKKLHLTGRSHGDVNPGNFLMGTNNLIVFDTKLKKIWPGNYQLHRDMRMFRGCFGEHTKYPYKKNIFYYYFIKEKLAKKLWSWLLQRL